jgi:hypothetical protein
MQHWGLSWHGVTTVAALELRQRVRSRRWLAALIAWFVVTGGVTLLVIGAVGSAYSTDYQYAWCTGEPGDGTVASCYLYAPYGGLGASCDIRAGGEVLGCVPEEIPVGQCYDGSRTVACSTLYADLQEPVCQSGLDGVTTCTFPASETYLGAQCTVDGPARTAGCEYLPTDGWTPTAGALVFSLVTMFILALGLLITPALTATSINGDRHAGVLATLQATRLSALEIALGKLAAAWLTVFAFLLAALPWLATGMVVGSIDLFQVLVCFAVLLVELAVVAAIGLGWSALISRTSGSTLLTYASVFTLSVLTVVFLGLLVPLTSTTGELAVYRLSDAGQAEYDLAWSRYYEDLYEDGVADRPEPEVPLDQCVWTTEPTPMERTDRIWWIMAVNPFVVVADAAPEPAIARSHPLVYANAGTESDLFAVIRGLIGGLRETPTAAVAWYPCESGPDAPDDAYNTYSYSRGDSGGVWPWGLGCHILIGAILFWITVRRLSVPYGPLPKGTRVA